MLGNVGEVVVESKGETGNEEGGCRRLEGRRGSLAQTGALAQKQPSSVSMLTKHHTSQNHSHNTKSGILVAYYLC